VGLTRETAEALRAKYVEMLEMRIAHDSGDDNAALARARMAALASRFPGALREIDDLELDMIRDRIVRLEAVLRDGADADRWMEAVALFHSVARGALCAKRWLGGRKRVDAALERAYAADVPGLPFPEDARAWEGDLASVASPPRGRLMDLVFARVAQILRTTRRDARQLVFGPPRRERMSRASQDIGELNRKAGRREG
jgi:hypothetical protein